MVNVKEAKMAKQLLEGIRILDQTMWQLGTVGTMMLAQMGAEVIKIEPPMGDPGRQMPMWVKGSEGKGSFGGNLSAYFENNNKCKKGMVLDLSKPKAREVIYELVKKSDVYVENLRPGIPEKLGVGYEDLRKINPRLIYFACSSFGTKGDDGAKPGYDLSGAARAGAMYVHNIGTGEPYQLMVGSFDQIGAIFISHGVLAALVARERDGVGQKVETSHLTASMWLMNLGIQIGYYMGVPDIMLSAFGVPREAATNPLWNYFKCADGKWMALTMTQPDRHWPVVCEVLGLGAVKDDPKFKNGAARAQNAREINAIFEGAFAKKTQDEWAKAFAGKDIFWERIQKFSDLANDPQVIANKYMVDYTHPLTGLTYKYQQLPNDFSETPAVRTGRAPLLGEHTEEILVDLLGYKKEDVPKLLDEIGRPTAFAGAGTMVVKTDED